MPDDAGEVPAVDLIGASMLALVEAIPEFEARTGRRATVIGGLAVLCRLGTVYRVTGDLDTANRRAVGEPPQLDVLLQQDDVTQADPDLPYSGADRLRCLEASGGVRRGSLRLSAIGRLRWSLRRPWAASDWEANASMLNQRLGVSWRTPALPL